jgi:hypothetical protein
VCNRARHFNELAGVFKSGLIVLPLLGGKGRLLGCSAQGIGRLGVRVSMGAFVDIRVVDFWGLAAC